MSIINKYCRHLMENRKMWEDFWGKSIYEVYRDNMKYLEEVAENQANEIKRATKNSGIYLELEPISIIPFAIDRMEYDVILAIMGQKHHIEKVNKNGIIYVR